MDTYAKTVERSHRLLEILELDNEIVQLGVVCKEGREFVGKGRVGRSLFHSRRQVRQAFVHGVGIFRRHFEHVLLQYCKKSEIFRIKKKKKVNINGRTVSAITLNVLLYAHKCI